tara:strand:- start:4428 stop:4958 length:531 start_codon:yes stop_codon:yes gene_type:complete
MKLLLLISFVVSVSAYNSPSDIKRLAVSNFKLVPYFGKYYIKKHNLNLYHRQELIQEGNIGLMNACRKYDETRGLKFSTYSKYWITRYMNVYIKKYYRDKDVLDIEKLDYKLKDKVTPPIYIDNLTEDEKHLLHQRFYQRKTYKELCKIYNISRETVRYRCNRIIYKLKIDNCNSI